MSKQNKGIYAVPTHIITGFLGVGKTTVILNMLSQKPNNERWAILVNEFGEIGVDGGLIQGNHSEQSGIFIKEVPGGCMCCAAGLPMHIALNQLLAKAKPDRLLIEPTGLGHPQEVLNVLSAEHYQDVLSVEQCLTLVDARKLNDKRYTEHATFNQQIDVADHIIGHKADLYTHADKQTLIEYIHARRGQAICVSFAQQGQIDMALLSIKRASPAFKSTENAHHLPHAHSLTTAPEQPIAPGGFVKVDNAGEGYQSEGWRFAPDQIFDRQALHQWLYHLKEQGVERAKGVFITPDGVFGYNLTPDGLTEIELDDCLESRIEIITPAKTLDRLSNQAGLFACRVTDDSDH